MKLTIPAAPIEAAVAVILYFVEKIKRTDICK